MICDINKPLLGWRR